MKSDSEVVPASTTFDMEIMLGNVTAAGSATYQYRHEASLYMALVLLGQTFTRLGVCLLEHSKNRDFDWLEMALRQKVRNERLRDYLLERRFPLEQDGEEFPQ